MNWREARLAALVEVEKAIDFHSKFLVEHHGEDPRYSDDEITEVVYHMDELKSSLTGRRDSMLKKEGGKNVEAK